MSARFLGAMLVAALLAPTAAFGAAHPRVVNGRPIKAPDYEAFLVAMGSDHYNQCGGTAIRPNVLLTAAHCLVSPDNNTYVAHDRLLMIFGIDDPVSAIEGTGPLPDDTVVDYVTPSNYGVRRGGGAVNDVALLRLSRPAPATMAVLPARRARILSPGRRSVVIGWGVQSDGGTAAATALQRADLTIQSAAYCGRYFRPFDRAGTVCAVSQSQSPCNGDSGGPLLVGDPADQRVYVAGVVSFGIRCRAGYPTVYTNVAGGPLAAFVRRQADRLQRQADAEAGAQPPVPAPPSIGDAGISR